MDIQKNGSSSTRTNSYTAFSAYLGFGQKKHAASFQTFIFGILTLLASIGIAFILKSCTELNFRLLMIISNITCSTLAGFIFFRMHGRYQLLKRGGCLYGRVRSSMIKLKILCISFVSIINIPSIIALVTVEENNNISKILWVTCVAFIGEILLLTLGHHFTTQYDEQKQKQEQISSTNISQVNIMQPPQKYFRVANPCIVILRDLLITLGNIIQAGIIVILFTYTPFQIWSKKLEDNQSLRSLGYWNQSSMQRGIFKFQKIVDKKYNTRTYWTILYQNQSFSTSFTNGQNVTLQKIQQLLQEDRYFSNWNYASMGNTSRIRNYDNIWKLSNGSYLIRQQTSTGFKFCLQSCNNNPPIPIYDPYSMNYAGYQPAKEGQIYFLFSQYYPDMLYIKQENLMYQFSNAQRLWYWINLTSYQNTTHSKYTCTLSSGYRYSASLIYSYLINTNYINKSLETYWSYPTGSDYRDLIYLRDTDRQFVDYSGGIFDITNIRYMKNINVSEMERVNFTLTNLQYQLKVTWSPIYPVSQTIRFFYLNNVQIPYTRYIIWCGVVTQCPTIFMLQNNGKIKQVLGKRLYENFYWPTSVPFKATVDEIQTFQYQYYPTKLVQYWLRILFGIISEVSFITSLIHFITRKCLKKISIKSKEKQQFLCGIRESLLHFLETFIILSVGAFPIYMLFFTLTQSPNINFFELSKISACLVTLFVYYMGIKSWRSHFYTPKWLNHLNILPYFLAQFFIKQTLKENDIKINEDMVNMIMEQGYSMQFLNSFMVRKTFTQFTNLQYLRQQLKVISQLPKRNLFTHQQQYQIQQETLNFSLPIFCYMFFLLIYTFLSYAFTINLRQRTINILGSLSVFPVLVSIIYFVWQHKNKVFVKTKQGMVYLRDTQRKDLLKLTLLGIIMAGIQCSMCFVGYQLGSQIGLGLSSKIMMSLGFWLVGFLLAYGTHFIWNYCPGVQGRIYKDNPGKN